MVLFIRLLNRLKFIPNLFVAIYSFSIINMDPVESLFIRVNYSCRLMEFISLFYTEL